MTETLLNRKANQHHRNARPSPKARLGGRQRLTRGNRLILLAMAYAATIALLVVSVGFTMLAQAGTGIRRHPAAAQPAGGNEGHNHGGPQPNIKIQTRNLGNLVLDVKANVSMNQGHDALMKAKVVMYTDMVEMPQSHAKGPIPLRESGRRHGLYEGTVNVPMPGDYKLRVVVQDPVQGETTTTVSVGAVDTNGQQPTSGGIPR